jgi:CRP-like cAMP-binding protein
MRTSSPAGLEGSDGGSSPAFANLLLAAMPARASIAPYLTRTELEPDTTIFAVGASITHYVFPVRGIVSIVKETTHGAMEIGAAGVEGMAGIPALLGVPISGARIFAQTPVVAYSLGVDAMNALLMSSTETRDLLLRYVHVVHEESCQSTLCARFHTLEERCARLLLVAHDRLGAADMPLKQRFLAQMLGAYRPAVSVAASTLQKEGLIHYRRGHVGISDREGLKQAACECYAVALETYERARLRWGILDPMEAGETTDASE